MSYILFGVVDLDDFSKNLRLMADFKGITDQTLTNDFRE